MPFAIISVNIYHDREYDREIFKPPEKNLSKFILMHGTIKKRFIKTIMFRRYLQVFKIMFDLHKINVSSALQGRIVGYAHFYYNVAIA